MTERVYICELHLFLKVNLDSSIGLRYSMLIKKVSSIRDKNNLCWKGS